MTRVSAEQRRRELTDAAVSLIYEEGPTAVTARRIAARAGASLSSVHYAFRDMDELMEAANRVVLANMARSVGAELRTDRGVRGFIEDLLRGYWHYLKTNEQEALAFFETFIALMRPGSAHTPVTAAREQLVALLSEAQRHDPRQARVPLEQLAILLTMTVDGISLIHLARDDKSQTEREVDQMIDALQCLA